MCPPCPLRLSRRLVILIIFRVREGSSRVFGPMRTKGAVVQDVG